MKREDLSRDDVVLKTIIDTHNRTTTLCGIIAVLTSTVSILGYVMFSHIQSYTRYEKRTSPSNHPYTPNKGKENKTRNYVYRHRYKPLDR